MKNDASAAVVVAGTNSATTRRVRTVKRVTLPENWRARATITVLEYALIMGVAAGTAYQASAAGDVRTVRVGGRILVSVPALLRQLEGQE